MLTVLTNIRSTKLLHHASCSAGRRLKFGMLTVLTNIRSTKVSWQVEDDLWQNTTFSGTRPSVEEDLRWKTTFGGRQPAVEDDLRWKTTCGGRRPSAEDDLCWILAWCLLRFAVFFFTEIQCHLLLLLCTTNSKKSEKTRPSQIIQTKMKTKPNCAELGSTELQLVV